MTLPRPALVVAVVALLAVGVGLYWLIGEPVTATTGGVAAAYAVRRTMRQDAREDADGIVGGLGPDPAVLRQDATQEDARIAAEAERVTLAELLDDWRRG